MTVIGPFNRYERFINEDTYEGKLDNPLSQNLYTYVHNNPLIYNDPSGHCVWDLCIAEGIGAVDAGTFIVGVIAVLWFDDEMSKANVIQQPKVKQGPTKLQQPPVVQQKPQVPAKPKVNTAPNVSQQTYPKVILKEQFDLLTGEKKGRLLAQGYKVVQFKKPKAGISGKEGAKDVPSWAKGNKPFVGENGKEFAERLLNERLGKGNYDTGPKSDFNKIKKWGDRSFQ